MKKTLLLMMLTIAVSQIENVLGASGEQQLKYENSEKNSDLEAFDKELVALEIYLSRTLYKVSQNDWDTSTIDLSRDFYRNRKNSIMNLTSIEELEKKLCECSNLCEVTKPLPANSLLARRVYTIIELLLIKQKISNNIK